LSPHSSPCPLLEVRNVSKNFTKGVVLGGFSLTIFPSEVVGLLGPNGAGKTTLFHTIMGLLRQDKGSIFFNGSDISSLAVHQRAKKGLGYLSQEPSIFRDLSVEKNILCILEMLNLSKEEKQARLKNALEELSLTELKNRKAASLSGGEKRRVEIAKALVTNPSLLLLDEPFANVDPITIADVKKTIQYLKEKGISVLVTDHNAREIFSCVDRTYLIRKGLLLAEGRTDELVANPVVRQEYLGESFTL